MAGAAAPRARVLEEGDVRAGAALLVRVEEVVDGRVVLVDRLLDEPQAEAGAKRVTRPRAQPGDQKEDRHPRAGPATDEHVERDVQEREEQGNETRSKVRARVERWL